MGYFAPDEVAGHALAVTELTGAGPPLATTFYPSRERARWEYSRAKAKPAEGLLGVSYFVTSPLAAWSFQNLSVSEAHAEAAAPNMTGDVAHLLTADRCRHAPVTNIDIERLERHANLI